MDEPDSFERQKEALFRYARYLKRVPTLAEGMQLLHEHRLFSGPWDDNLALRRARVRSILSFIARTVDSGKCANGSVNVGKYDAWAATRFPNGLVGGGRRYVTEDGEVVEGCLGIHVSAKFIAVFMAIAEFALLIDKNQDDSVPHDRASELWNALFAKGLISVKFSARKWAVCREELVKHGVIAVTDRDYRPGKAMKWATGLYFPFLGLWKTTKKPSLLGSVDLGSFLQNKRKRTTEQHNTVLHSQAVQPAVLGCLTRSRPPPLAVGVS
jgi:hypothetical protein